MNIQWNRKRSPPPVESAPAPREKSRKYHSWDIRVFPIELVVKIFANLAACDLLVCTKVNKHWQNIIVTEPAIARIFFRSCRPSVPTWPSLTALPRSPATLIPWQNYYRSIRDWLKGFNEQGRQAVLRLDKGLDPVSQRFPEQLFINIANVLGQPRDVDGKEVFTIEYGRADIETFFSPNEQHLVVASWDRPAQIYSLINQQWQEIATTAPSLTEVRTVSFSANSQHLLVQSEHDSVEIWSLVGRTWQKNIHISYAASLPSFSAQTQYLVAVDRAHAKIYQLIGGQWQLQTTAIDNCLTTYACFHPMDNQLLATSYTNTVNIWRCINEQWQQHACLPHIHDSGLYFSPDGCRLLAGYRQIEWPEPDAEQRVKTARIWHCVDGVWQQEAVLPLDASLCAAHFSSDRDALVTVSNEETKVWRLAGDAWKDVSPPAFNNVPNKCRLSADGQRLVTRRAWGVGRKARVWRFDQGQWRKERCIRHPRIVNCIHWDSLSNHVITASGDHTARIYGYTGKAWQKKATLRHRGCVASAGFSPFGRYVVTNTIDTVHLWMLHHTENKNRDISTLPIKLAIKIFANLDACDLLVCARVSKYWQNLIVTEPTIAKILFRCCRPSVPTLPSLTALPRSPATLIPWQNYYLSIRDWLTCVNEQGRQAVLRLDPMLKSADQCFPEQLFLTVANTLAQLRGFTCKEVLTIHHPRDKVTNIHFSPDEQHLVVVCRHHPITIYSLINEQWQNVPTIPQSAKVKFAGFSANSQALVTLCEHHSAEIWGLAGNRWQRNTHIAYARQLPSFSAQSQYLVAIHREQIARIYQLADGQWPLQITAIDNCPATEACFNPVDNHLLATSCKNTVNIWCCINGQWQHNARLPYTFDQCRLYFSPDGRRLLTGSREAEHKHCACIWHAVDGVWQREAVLPLTTAMETAHFSSVRDSLITMSDRWSKLWQLSADQWREIPLPERGHPCGYLGADGQHLAIYSLTWRISNTARVWRFAGDKWHEQAAIWHADSVNDIRFSCHGNHVITASDDRTARIYGYIGRKWRKKATLAHADRVISARFSSFGRYVLTKTMDETDTKTTHLWTLNDQEQREASETESDDD